jgi:glycosyltransferase involved in cell wall biosynthesis
MLSLNRAVYAVVVGDGPDRIEFLRLAAAHSTPIRFVGHQEDVARRVAVGDAIAVPTHREAFGVAAAEAMSCGRPVVASALVLCARPLIIGSPDCLCRRVRCNDSRRH